jgi:hypothetical protein
MGSQHSGEPPFRNSAATALAPSAARYAALAIQSECVFIGVSDVRRPWGTVLSPEDRSLARRWALALPSVYSTILVIVMIAAALASSTANKVAVVASSEANAPLSDRSDNRLHRPLPYGSLPNAL